MPGGSSPSSRTILARLAGASILTLTLAACGGPASSQGTGAPHAHLGASLASQSVYVTLSLGQQVQNDGLALALNAQTGALRWKTNTGGTGGTPAVAGGAVYLASEDGSIRSLDATTGKQRWSYARTVGISAQYGFDGYAAVSGDTVYVTSDSGAVFALDTATGALRWQRAWPHAGDTVYAAPAVADGMVFVPVAGPDGGAYALDATSGAIIWQQTAHTLGFDSVPLVANGAVYFGSQNAYTLSSFEEKTGAPRWQADSSAINAPAVAANGLVYVAGADAIIRAYHAQDGTPAWTFQTGGSVGTALLGTGAAMTVVGETLYAGAQGGVLYALNALTGKQLWQVAQTGAVDQPPAVADGAVFVASEDGVVRAYRASDGAPAWVYNAVESASSGGNITSGVVVASATGQ